MEGEPGTARQEPMKLVFIDGQIASGKLTVGRDLADLTGLPLCHNHLIVDAVGAVFPLVPSLSFAYVKPCGREAGLPDLRERQSSSPLAIIPVTTFLMKASVAGSKDSCFSSEATSAQVSRGTCSPARPIRKQRRAVRPARRGALRRAASDLAGFRERRRWRRARPRASPRLPWRRRTRPRSGAREPGMGPRW
jgi:hypothetical protein